MKTKTRAVHWVLRTGLIVLGTFAVLVLLLVYLFVVPVRIEMLIVNGTSVSTGPLSVKIGPCLIEVAPIQSHESSLGRGWCRTDARLVVEDPKRKVSIPCAYLMQEFPSILTKRWNANIRLVEDGDSARYVCEFAM